MIYEDSCQSFPLDINLQDILLAISISFSEHVNTYEGGKNHAI